MSEAQLIVRLYEALHTISKGYQTPAQLRRDSEGDWGLGFEESLEYAYENIQQTAARAIKGVRIAKYRAALSPKAQEGA